MSFLNVVGMLALIFLGSVIHFLQLGGKFGGLLWQLFAALPHVGLVSLHAFSFQSTDHGRDVVFNKILYLVRNPVELLGEIFDLLEAVCVLEVLDRITHCL